MLWHKMAWLFMVLACHWTPNMNNFAIHSKPMVTIFFFMLSILLYNFASLRLPWFFCTWYFVVATKHYSSSGQSFFSIPVFGTHEKTRSLPTKLPLLIHLLTYILTKMTSLHSDEWVLCTLIMLLSWGRSYCIADFNAYTLNHIVYNQ